MITIYVVLVWFVVLFLLMIGRWSKDNDNEGIIGVFVALGIPAFVALCELIWRLCYG
jgi:predicted secreted protein